MDRTDVFIETKVWVSDYGYDQTQHAFDKAAGKLGVEQTDLLILHQPAPARFEQTIAAYCGLERLLADGKVRAIGVSNFMPEHPDTLIENTDVVPAINQVELHPYFTQPAVQDSDRAHGILTQANPAHIAENFDVFDFTLTADELAAIDALDTGVRHGPDPDERDPHSLGLMIDEA
ncbi:aldo/keto reductase [Streptomyces coelicoflavus]|uniref:aldo/keto reductase n=1 Tax=Streptomyces coelicoflavus TaxID=285562 RepID=UPI0024ADE7A1|nr:aldo/keto reductase [Streptomyces coelicoflavus]MDI6521744.1 aldo/keto reductase [Streptomyces coelicoflavus]